MIDSFPTLPLLFVLGIFAFILLWLIVRQVLGAAEKVTGGVKRPEKGARAIMYASGGEVYLKPSPNLETDIRLTYKRFKELYPYSRIPYKDYKKLQKEKAFKRAVSSQKIKRMVR